MRDQRLRGMWKPLGVFLFFLGVQLLVSAVAALVAQHSLSSQNLTPKELDDAVLAVVTSWSSVLVLIADGVTVAALLLWNRIKGKQAFLDYTSLRTPIGAGGGVLCLIAGVAACFWFSLVINLFPWPEAWISQYAENSAALTGRDLITVLAVAVFAPCCEELVFRGRIYGGLTSLIPAGAATILQAILFGGLHDGTVWICYAFVLGCILGYLRKLTGSLRAPLILHAAFNASAYLFEWYADRWGEQGKVLMTTLVASAGIFLISLLALNGRYRKGREDEEK